MGKIRLKTLGEDEVEKKQKNDDAKRRAVKTQRKAQEEGVEDASVQANQAMKQGLEEILAENKDLVVDSQEAQEEQEASEDTKGLPPQLRKKKRVGSKYNKSAKKVESGKKYTLSEALKLMKDMSYASFDESVELHLNMKETGLRTSATLPHGTGKKLNIAVLDDKLIKEIEDGVINFDVLIATPAMMPKAAKLARILGPKGLMPNPKNGTVSDNPEEATKKLQGGSVQVKTEAKFPIVHQVVGKASFSDEMLRENIVEVVKVCKKNAIKTAFLTSSMTPSVQLDIESL